MTYVTISEVEYKLLKEFLSICATPQELQTLYNKAHDIATDILPPPTNQFPILYSFWEDT